jgi:hypothetical protein
VRRGDRDRAHPARSRRSPDRGVRPRTPADPRHTRRPAQSWPAAISPCAMASTRTPRAVNATRRWCRGWTSPYRTAGTRLSASTDMPAVTACKMNTSSSRRASSASVRGNSAAVVMDTNLRATTDNGVDPHNLCRSHHPGHARAAHAAGLSAGVVLQECCRYPEQPGLRVHLLLPVEHTNRARHPRGSPGVPLNAAKVGLKFVHEPKEIDVEPRILGTRLRMTGAYRSYGARVGSRWWQSAASDERRRARPSLFFSFLASSIISCRGSNIGWAGTHLRLRPAHSANAPRRLASLSFGRLTRTVSQISRPTGRSSSMIRPSRCTARCARCA